MLNLFARASLYCCSPSIGHRRGSTSHSVGTGILGRKWGAVSCTVDILLDLLASEVAVDDRVRVNGEASPSLKGFAEEPPCDTVSSHLLRRLLRQVRRKKYMPQSRTRAATIPRAEKIPATAPVFWRIELCRELELAVGFAYTTVEITKTPSVAVLVAMEVTKDGVPTDVVPFCTTVTTSGFTKVLTGNKVVVLVAVTTVTVWTVGSVLLCGTTCGVDAEPLVCEPTG